MLFRQGIKINTEIYRNVILLYIYHWKAIHETHYLPVGTTILIMEDNAAVYKAKKVKEEHQK